MIDTHEQVWPKLAEAGSSAPRADRRRAPAATGRRTSTRLGVRDWLAGLTIVLVLLTCLPSGFLIWRSYENERATLQRHSLETARALVLAIDAEFARMLASVNALTTSPFLDAGNFAALHRQAEVVLRDYPGGSLSLADRSGHQLLNTLQPLGEPLPERANKALLDRVFETAQPSVSDLFVGAVTHEPLVAVGAPVIRDGGVVYDMTMAVPPEMFSAILEKQDLPPGWVGAIGDSGGTIVARTRSADRFVGQPFVPKLLRHLAESNEGMIETLSLENTPVFTAYSRGSFSGWTVAIGIPRAEFNQQVWQSLWITACGVLFLLVAALTLAFVIGRRVAGPIQALTAPALAVGLGERVQIPRLGLREADEVGRSLQSASRLLRKHAWERDQAAEERARAETWLRLAMEAGAMGTWEFDPITQRVVASESTDAMFGLSRDGSRRSIADYMRSVHPDDIERLKRETELGGQRGDISIECRLIGPEGGARWIAARGSKVDAPDGGKRIVGALFDITERKAAEAALANALQEKGMLLTQKEILVKEINHRVKNSLQSVSAMLRLQAANSQDRMLRQQLMDADQRVLIIAQAHEHLYRQAEAADKVEIAQYLRDMCGSLEKTAPQTGGDVSIVVDADRLEMATDQALSIALLVNELVTNALKHAFRNKPAGTITVTFRIQPEGHRRLCIADNGNGLPDGFAPEQSAGLGMKLVNGFVRSLGGELIIETSRFGCRYTVLMPPAASADRCAHKPRT